MAFPVKEKRFTFAVLNQDNTIIKFVLVRACSSMNAYKKAETRINLAANERLDLRRSIRDQ